MMMTSRRNFLQHTAAGIGMVAVSRLLAAPHFNGTAKNVIFLYMPGGPSQIDLYDPKPELAKWHGKPLPQSLTKDLKLAFIKPTAAVVGEPRVFPLGGQSGTEISDWLPNLAKRADDLCLLRAVHTEAFNHDPGEMFLMTGHSQFGRPSMGSWVVYGLGSESKDLPGIRSAQLWNSAERGGKQLVCRISALVVSGDTVPRNGRTDPIPR